MPSEQSEIYGDIVLFGIRVAFCANDRRVLDTALALYPDWRNLEQPHDGAVIYVVLTAYDVNRAMDDLHDVEGAHLAIRRKGIVVEADGIARKGACRFPSGAHDDDLAELINTMVLFLVGHAGRVPLHASAVMLDGTAMVFAGRSGSGKSTLALAATRAGLPLMSDDTIYVQTAPVFRLWSLAGPIHVFEKDAPADQPAGSRFRGGRWKKSLQPAERRQIAGRAVLFLLESGSCVEVKPLEPGEAVNRLVQNPEQGYQFYGEDSLTAARALAAGGAWRLTLSQDPVEAIERIRDYFAKAGGISFYGRYRALVEEIERRFAVTSWKSGDADLWPLARFDLYLDMYWDNADAGWPRPRYFPLRVTAALLKPARNLWRSRRDLARCCFWPRRAPAIFLGDGVSLDRIAGSFQDRQGEPLMAALEKRGLQTFLMQAGELVRLPWKRRTFAANLVEGWAWLLSPFFAARPRLADHAGVMSFLAGHGVRAPSLARHAIAKRARILHAASFLFGHLLNRVRPRLGFVVSYYAGLGPAFVLACRRRKILSVDVQHAPLEGAPMAYVFGAYPPGGFTTLPAVFWSWTDEDAQSVSRSAHRGFRGGAPQLSLLNQTGIWPDFPAGDFEREILVALQPIAGRGEEWEALAAVIEAAPVNWRWWIRRHPASRPDQDCEFGRLLSLRRSNVEMEAAALPLPVLLRRMSAVLSLASGVAMEAARFGVPAFFLSDEARSVFGGLIAQGGARVIRMDDIHACIGALASRPGHDPDHVPALEDSIDRLERWARDYEPGTRIFRDHVNIGAARCMENRKLV